jgi:nitrogen fixation-related uncharacterized protein
METWMTIATFVLIFIAVGVAAMLWGADSRYDTYHRDAEQSQAHGALAGR